MRRDLYPPYKHWLTISRQCKRDAGWTCQRCKVEAGMLVESKRQPGTFYFRRLAAHHIDGDKRNHQPRLQALCPECHGIVTWEERQARQELELERQKHRHLLEKETRMLSSIEQLRRLIEQGIVIVKEVCL